LADPFGLRRTSHPPSWLLASIPVFTESEFSSSSSAWPALLTCVRRSLLRRPVRCAVPPDSRWASQLSGFLPSTFPVLTGCQHAEAFCLRPTSKPSFLNSSGVASEAGHPTCVGQLNLSRCGLIQVRVTARSSVEGTLGFAPLCEQERNVEVMCKTILKLNSSGFLSSFDECHK